MTVLAALRESIMQHPFQDETESVTALLDMMDMDAQMKARIHDRAKTIVEQMRSHPVLGVEAFMHKYKLSQREGVLIMCLAEALLRVPDALTADRLIKDKVSTAQWEHYLKSGSSSFLVNASAWGLMLTGKVIGFDEDKNDPITLMHKMLSRMGEPAVRQALKTAMRWMGTQFILGETIEDGLKNAKDQMKDGFTHSYDMLGEGARTDHYARDYISRYRHAISQIGQSSTGRSDLFAKPGISIKLSALHPRYEGRQRDRVMSELYPRLKELMGLAKQYNLIASIDAEEAARLDISLDLFQKLAKDSDLQGWNGLSLVVQAYQKRAIHIIKWVGELAKQTKRVIPIRLVKGAYWDTEIKNAQVMGLEGYPVFTRKHATDLSYLACAKTMLAYQDRLYPMFATHNAHTVASILEMAGNNTQFEFQKLHGMGDGLYQQLHALTGGTVRCRIYAPIGEHKDLLAYLVRRLLENGANSSFINQLADPNIPLDDLISDPVDEMRRLQATPNPAIPLPQDIYGPLRPNSRGYDYNYDLHRNFLESKLKAFSANIWHGFSLINGKRKGVTERTITNPAILDQQVGVSHEVGAEQAKQAMDSAVEAFTSWSNLPVLERAAILRRAADLYQQHEGELLALLIREGGRFLQDAIDEVREAIDFLHYYALQAEKTFDAMGLRLQGPTGEDNRLFLQPRGVFLCISPWNFPLAIFTGQIAAALVTGNTVLAKPAEQTPLIAARAVELLHEAGTPQNALHLLLGDGPTIGIPLLADKRLGGVVFTGSTETAHIIQRALVERGGAIVPLIAETGGQNCMIVDSTALPEQVVDDAILSAFGSAGQRCSALRVMFIQEEIADSVIAMLKGAIQERRLGDPWDFRTDIGPVIDKEAYDGLEAHRLWLQEHEKCVHDNRNCSQQSTKPASANQAYITGSGYFFSPVIYEIKHISELDKENFGPILHIIRYQAKELDEVIDQINSTGYGLTLGIHSRIDATIQRIVGRMRVGNIYVNRGMTGAVVGVHPFGGEGLSGTGFKAGGPHYLLRFATERTLTVNTAAIGGNVALVAA